MLQLTKVIQDNPLIVIACAVAAIVAAVWKVLDALYVQPRNYRISELEKKLEDLRKEFVARVPDRGEPPPPQAAPSIVESERCLEMPKRGDDLARVVAQTEPSSTAALADAPVDPMSSLDACYRAWRKPGQTKLQIADFEEAHAGRSIRWEAVVTSVNKESDTIFFYAASPYESDHRVTARFPASAQKELIAYKPGDRITISGPIREFFIYPVIQPATIVRA